MAAEGAQGKGKRKKERERETETKIPNVCACLCIARRPRQGYQFLLTHAIRSSNHAFVTGMTFLGSLAPLMNGAAVQVFPGDASPINLIATLVNYPQTRKSQNTKLVKMLADALDAHVAAQAEKAVSNSLAAQGVSRKDQAEDPTAEKPRLHTASSTITCFTPEVFFERFSGDFQQLQNAADTGTPDRTIVTTRVSRHREGCVCVCVSVSYVHMPSPQAFHSFCFSLRDLSFAKMLPAGCAWLACRRCMHGAA